MVVLSTAAAPYHPSASPFPSSTMLLRGHNLPALAPAAAAAFLAGPFLLQHNKWRHSTPDRLQALPATKTKAPIPTPSSAPFPSSPAPAAAALPRRLVAKPLVDARQLSPQEVALRFADVDFAVPKTLPQALAVFASHPSIQIIAAGLVAIAGARMSQGGGVSPAEALVAVPFTVAGWVVQEWAIHRHLLHTSLHWPGSSIHRQHHELPFYHVSIDPPVVVLAWGAVACAVALALVPQPLAWTVLGTYWLMGLVYEWSHFIVHTRVQPRTKLGRAIKAHHTRHHLVDDRFWFAFSWPPIDAILGTVPFPSASDRGRGKDGQGEGFSSM